MARRIEPRIPVDISVDVFSGSLAGAHIGRGTLINLSTSGCLLLLGSLMRRRAAYRLHLTWAAGELDLIGRVVRGGTRAPFDSRLRLYGIELSTTKSQADILRRLIRLLERRLPPRRDSFLKNYWTPES